MEKEIKITPPEGYEIDKENSTFECIKFKPKVEQWRSKMRFMTGYYTTYKSQIQSLHGTFNPLLSSIFATEKQAESAVAMAQISQILINDSRYGGPVTDEEWNDSNKLKFVIVRVKDVYAYDTLRTAYTFLAFHTREQRDLFFQENTDLVFKYLMV